MNQIDRFLLIPNILMGEICSYLNVDEIYYYKCIKLSKYWYNYLISKDIGNNCGCLYNCNYIKFEKYKFERCEKIIMNFNFVNLNNMLLKSIDLSQFNPLNLKMMPNLKILRLNGCTLKHEFLNSLPESLEEFKMVDSTVDIDNWYVTLPDYMQSETKESSTLVVLPKKLKRLLLMYNTFKYEIFFTTSHCLDLVFIKLDINSALIKQLQLNGAMRSISEIKHIKKFVIALVTYVEFNIHQIDLPNNFEELDMSSKTSNIRRMNFPLSIKKMKLYIVDYLGPVDAKILISNIALNKELKDISINEKHQTVLQLAMNELKYLEEVKFE